MSTNINISSSGISSEFAQDSTFPNVYYCGTAKLNSSILDPVWTVRKLIVNINGNVAVQKPDTSPANSPVIWNIRETYTYIAV
jgi:hypothetical protein